MAKVYFAVLLLGVMAHPYSAAFAGKNVGKNTLAYFSKASLTKKKFYNFDLVVIEVKKAGNQNDVSQIFYIIIILSLEWSSLTVYTREGSSLTREY